MELANVDLNLLVAFRVLYHERSVTRAAKRLHLGQPSMSAALGRLRSLWADELFVRVGREMQPTSKAAAIAPHIFQALDMIHHTLVNQQVFVPEKSQKILTLGASDYLASLILPKLLRILAEQAPLIDLRLVTLEKESWAERLQGGEMDVALGTFAEVPSHIMTCDLLTEGWVGLCRRGHPACDQGVISLGQYLHYPHALFTLRRDAVGIIDQVLALQGCQRRIALTVPYWFALPPVIAESDLLTAVPTCLQTLVSDRLCSFPIPLDLPCWCVSMAWSKRLDSDPANRWLRQIIAEMSSEIRSGMLSGHG